MIRLMLQSVRLQTQKHWWPLALTVICLFTVLPGFFLAFEDSEIWGITSSRRFVDDVGSLSSAHFKPLFSAIFGLVVHLAPTDWSALTFSRWLTLALAAGGLFCLYSIALESLKTGRSKSLTVLLLALFTTMPLFLIHFPKVRSDSVAASFALFGILLLLRRPQLASIIYLLTSLIVLLITPKSLDLVAALSVFYWNVSRRPAIQKFAMISGPSASILLIGLLWGRESMARVLMYWLDSYKENSFLGKQHWDHVWISFLSAPASHLILALGLCLGLWKFGSRPPAERTMILAGWTVVLFVLVHSQKFHFFLASRLPFIALAAVPGIFWLFDFLKATQPKWSFFEKRLLLIFAALVSITLASTTLRHERLSMYEMSQQKIAHEELRKFLVDTGPVTYWDGIGLFPKMNTIFHYPSPGDRENRDLLRYAEMSKPGIVIRTSKMELLEPELFGWLTKHYASIQNFISTRIAIIDPVYFRSNCEVSVTDLDRLREANQLTGEIILLVDTGDSSTWSQFPFAADPIGTRTIRKRLSEFDKAESIVFKNCRQKNTTFALSSEQPWLAGAPSANLLLFSYDGRL